MRHKIEAIMERLIGIDGEEPIIKGIIAEQFRPDEESDSATLRNLNASFLIVLCGQRHPLFEKARNYLERFRSLSKWHGITEFYLDGLSLVCTEIEDTCSKDKEFREELDQLTEWISDRARCSDPMDTAERMRKVFFPEGVGLCDDRTDKISKLREKRKVTVTSLNPSPVKDPVREVLFSSNVLLTIPHKSKIICDLQLPHVLCEKVDQVSREEQLYWYDHPIPIGIDLDNNEALYGLKGLDSALEFEKERGTVKKDAVLDCVLSVSVTHRGLQSVAKEYLEEEFKKAKGFKNLNLYVFTEADTSRLIGEIILPAMERYRGEETLDPRTVHEIIGVDGEYGRHFSFLKAVAAFWKVCIDSEIRGTFKIDLDQVFPQKELVEEGGSSAFEHLKTPLWGADGIDYQGRSVELGMLAGTLVNKNDIDTSIFCPDVCFPPHSLKAEEYIFQSLLPQALSTEAEMMTRYSEETLNGKDHCIQRIHVTGGTCGVLIDSLRKYRPFTPTFIGRAEDQAYILSVLFHDSQKNLRYVHKDGLIMRHDKEDFALEAIKAAHIGKLVGDYVRILLFSFYARALPWSVEEIKVLIDPFTGCFVSRIPFTVVYLRFALKAASFFMQGTGEDHDKGVQFIDMGAKRLHDIIQELKRKPNPLIERFERERKVWDLYYDALDCIEEGINGVDSFALELQNRAKRLVESCRMRVDTSP
jgi:hypothetical protein